MARDVAEQTARLEHPQRHRGFHLESSGLSLFSTVSGRAVAVHCVSETDVEKKPRFKGYLNFGQSYSVL